MTDARTTRHRVLAAVAADLRPVRPVLPPRVRTLFLLPLAAVVTLLAINRYQRPGLAELTPFLSWGLSAVQWSLGVLVLGVAFREATPGSWLSRRQLTSLLLVTSGLILATTWLTYAAQPWFIPRGRALILTYLCFVGPLKLGIPLLLLASYLTARAVPTTPVRVGALCGLAAGVIVDAGWRLTCQFTAPLHVMTAHAAAILALGAGGALLGAAFDRLGPWRS